jgi:flagellar motor switch protein FliM
MSQDFLSQEEVDALLKGVSGEADEAAPEAGNHDVKSLRPRPSGAHRPWQHADAGAHQRALRPLPAHRPVQLHAQGRRGLGGPIKVQKYSEFIRNLVVPTNLNLIQAKPLRGTGLIVLDPNLVFLVVDNMFGGDGRFHTRVEGRDFTATEQRIIQGMLGRRLRGIPARLAAGLSAEIRVRPLGNEHAVCQYRDPSEVDISMTFTLELSGNTAELHFCLPYSMVEPIRDLLTAPCTASRLRPTSAGPAC